ncbi:hypothetical protein [Phascolarctobacterium sp.]|uniref:hypothetical protein n=1 Tax=Phascolarctobacterium sp. TaxID=2049039 RepID=UPI00386FCD2F
MSTASNVFQSMIENALLQTHTAFCAKVISVSGNYASVQPLNMVKAVGGTAQKQAVIPKVPILQPTHEAEVTYNSQKCKVTYKNDIKKGDTVFCVCAERDITETRKGKFALPVKGRHMLSDAVIVGKF